MEIWSGTCLGCCYKPFDPYVTAAGAWSNLLAISQTRFQCVLDSPRTALFQRFQTFFFRRCHVGGVFYFGGLRISSLNFANDVARFIRWRPPVHRCARNGDQQVQICGHGPQTEKGVVITPGQG